MAEALQNYRSKRDFGKTSEPEGGSVKSGESLSFVIQKHAASRLHYDFRLELGGTLKSWAVPKGPSLDPADKRMAVHVEDHPLEYASFEGVIPPKQYGAGTVIVWDKGTWTPLGDPQAAYREGKIKFELHGEKLQGHWMLVRMHGRAGERQEPWLLIKERDAAARPAADYNILEALPDSVNAAPGKSVKAKVGQKSAAKTGKAVKGSSRMPASESETFPTGAAQAALPLALSPQLATLVDSAPSSGDWLYEIKFDGYRVMARIDGADVRLFTRNGHNWTSRMKHVAKAIAALELPSGWLDGEVVIATQDGRTDFQELQNAFDSDRTESIQYFLFDIPFYAGSDLRSCALRDRRGLLRQLLARNTSSHLRFSEDFEADPKTLLHSACQLRLEGVIGKRADSAYVSARSPSWIKLKCTQRQEFVIGGYTDPQGSRTGLGSLLLGVHDLQGRLMYAGNVGTGFDQKTLTELSRQLAELKADKAAFHDLPKAIKGHWVKPKLVAEVSFGEWTKEGRIRHSAFHGLRTDKEPGTIVREKPMPTDELGSQKKTAAKRAKPAAPTSGGVKITHGERVIDTTTGLTKLDLLHYYESIAAIMLPHLKSRPVSLVRGPAGVAGQLFFQKHADTLKIPGVIELDPAFLPGHPPMIEIASQSALLQAAQLNVIEFHTWNATTRSIENPDRMVFDLDPGEGVKWPQVVEGAMLTKALLDELKLKAFLKTSGGKGLHLVVPLSPVANWDEVKDFSRAVVQHLAKAIPQRFVAKSGPSNRVGKIFVDYLRNGRGATTATAFSARARPGLGVSMPVLWEELETLKGGDQWNITNAIQRVAKLSADPWAEYKKSRQTTERAAKILGLNTERSLATGTSSRTKAR